MAASKAETQQAFRSLIQSVTNVDTGSSGSKSNLSSEAIQRLTERLSEIVGYDTIKDFTPQKNDRGELVNEEGLPIIDITEPISGSASDDQPVYVAFDPIVRLNEVAPPTRQRLRDQRDRILDMLEAEEREEVEKEKAEEREKYADIARKRAEAAATEKERLKAVKEMQKKMGKALLRNMAESKDKKEKEKEAQRLKDEEEDAKRKANSTKKKNVTFAPDVVEEKSEEKPDWGDVVPAQLHRLNRPTLLSEHQAEKGPMKMKVVERVLGSQKPLRSPIAPAPPERDSDDESDAEDESLTHERASSPPPHSPISDESGSDEEELEEETDLDYAALQRQIELEYHEKRAKIGQAAASAMEEISKQPPEETTKTEDKLGVSFHDPSKPAISQFRANRLASAYGASNPSSTSAGAGDFVVPVATAKTIQKSIRTGKLDNKGNLVGSEDDSASEAEDEGMQEVLELLKKGEVYNLGPNGEYIHAVRPEGVNLTGATPTSTALRLDNSKTLPPLTAKTPVSKFKVSRTTAVRPHELAGPSPLSTPVNELSRSSPKSETPPVPPGQVPPPRSPKPPAVTPSPMSMIVDSPSFAPPPGSSSSATPPFFSMIVDSPSFPPAAGTKMPIAQHGAPTPRSSSRPERPPTVIASSVRESKPGNVPKPDAASPEPPSQAPPAKVSRFRRERM